MAAGPLPQRVHLASRSPRRRELLAQIGVAFDTISFRGTPREDAAVDETPLPGEDARHYVERLARSKAEHGCELVRQRRLLPQPVLAADTTLELAGELIGKPADADDACRILRCLSGRNHRVLTAVAVAFQGRIEPLDKAGAYGIQGRAGMFVEHLAGSYSGVMGLPLCETAQLLTRCGVLP